VVGCLWELEPVARAPGLRVSTVGGGTSIARQIARAATTSLLPRPAGFST
jgi:hypothetical protein